MKHQTVQPSIDKHPRDSFTPNEHYKTAIQSECTVSQGIFIPVFAFKFMHRVILLTRFCKLFTTVAILSGGHVPQVPQ